MKKVIALASLCTVGLANAWPIMNSNCSPISGSAFAASKKKAAECKDGIEPEARSYINQGQWEEAINRLKTLSDASPTAGRDAGWLAFAYLYQGKKDNLKEFAQKVKELPVNEADPAAAKIVAAFASTAQGKLEDADKILASQTDDKDLLLLFTKACVALKRGNPKEASEYCEKCLVLEPTFAWGYRTLGFIQEKSLQNLPSAEISYQKAVDCSPKFKEARDLLIDLKLRRNDFDGAIALAQEALKLGPKDAVNYFRLSQIYIQQWRLTEALALLNKAIDLNSTDPRYFQAKATIFRQQGKFSEAIVEQKRAVDLQKDKTFELLDLAFFQEQNKDVEGAIASLNEVLKAKPSQPIARQRLITLLAHEKRYDDLVNEYKKILELEPKNVTVRIGYAEALRFSGKTEEALAQLKEAANLNDKDPTAHRQVAKIELARKNYVAAAKSYTRALNINPGSVDDLVALGFCYANNGDYMQAETAFVTGLALQQLGQTMGSNNPINPFDIMRSLASVLMTEGRYREASVNLEAVVGADKSAESKRQDQFMLSQAKALRDCNRQTRDELIASYNALTPEEQNSNRNVVIDTLFSLDKTALAIELARKTPDDVLRKNSPLALAKVLAAEGKLKEAEDLCRQLISEPGDNQDESNLELGNVLSLKTDVSGAESAFQKAVELNPKGFSALVDKGRLYLKAKRTDDAITAGQKALEINPYCVPAYLLLAEAYMGTGKIKDSENNYLKAVELYPSSIEAHRGLREVLKKQSKTDDIKHEDEIISNLEKNS